MKPNSIWSSRHSRQKVELLAYDAEHAVYRFKKRNELTPLISVTLGTFVTEFEKDES
jgi:hypothetical protein